MKTIGNDGLHKLVQAFGGQKTQAKTVIGHANGEEINFFEGIINGMIVAPRGDTNFSWDSVFYPDGYEGIFAEMTKEEKSAISMRKIAFQN